MKTLILLSTLFWASLFYTAAHAQTSFSRKIDVSPAFLTRHGAYYNVENTYSAEAMVLHSILFYNDGTFYYGGYEFDNTMSIDKILNTYNNPKQDNSSLSLRDAWGSYHISNDTIYMQRFSYTPGNEYSSQTTGMVAIIKSDSSFNMIKETCEWCGINEYYGQQGHVYEAPLAFNLYRLNRLPDASTAWFRKKSWFVMGNMQQTLALNNR